MKTQFGLATPAEDQNTTALVLCSRLDQVTMPGADRHLKSFPATVANSVSYIIAWLSEVDNATPLWYFIQERGTDIIQELASDPDGFALLERLHTLATAAHPNQEEQEFLTAAAAQFFECNISASLSNRFSILPSVEGPLLDIGTGITGALYIPNFPPALEVAFVDTSFFVSRYLQYACTKFGARNITVLHQDARQLSFPENSLGTIRLKNVAAYIPDFASYFTPMTKWLRSGGMVLIETDVDQPYQAHDIINLYGEHIESLLQNDGWSLNCLLGVAPAGWQPGLRDVAMLKKPGGSSSFLEGQDALELWSWYCSTISYHRPEREH